MTEPTEPGEPGEPTAERGSGGASEPPSANAPDASPVASRGAVKTAPAAVRRRRWRRARIKRPTQAELDALSAKDRLELLEKKQSSRHQWFNTSGILLTIVFTALGLFFTRQTLISSREGQITDRYTKAVEQLGSKQREVRLGAIYALERIAYDSSHDRPTINDVLAAFVREHDPKPSVKDAKLPPEPDTDVQACLTILGRTPHPAQSTDLHSIRTPHAGLLSAHFHEANLAHADLTYAIMDGADLSSAYLPGAELTGVSGTGINLSDANLIRIDLQRAQLYAAKLVDAGLADADVSFAFLSSAKLIGTNLSRTNLRATT